MHKGKDDISSLKMTKQDEVDEGVLVEENSNRLHVAGWIKQYIPNHEKSESVSDVNDHLIKEYLMMAWNILTPLFSSYTRIATDVIFFSSLQTDGKHVVS